MKTFDVETFSLIKTELENIPEKYQKNFNSTHEGYAVILEEVRELEKEVFFGEKECKKLFPHDHLTTQQGKDEQKDKAHQMHKNRMREECVQIAAMCARFIQELT